MHDSKERTLLIMKKLRLIPLLVLLLCCLCVTAMAAGISGQQSISAVQDANGYVTDLTDDDASTAWIRQEGRGADLTLSFYNARVGEIWIRNGYAYTQNWYSHYDRPSLIKVTVYYYANQVTETYDTFRYRLTDACRPSSISQDWNSGYQRLLLPKQYRNVTRIELTIEEAISGAGHTGVAISDIIAASGNHATATPRAYATATPKPYIVYITPTPGPQVEEDDYWGDYVEWITPVPEDSKDDGVDFIVPGDKGDDATPTKTPLITIITPKPTEPLVELITPKPTSEPIDYPSLGGVIATLTKRAATRSGPGTGFDEPGSFFQAGQEVKVISKVWDNRNSVYWYQIEFEFKNEWYRVYTTDSRVNVDENKVPDEPALNDPLDSCRILRKVKARFGPGEEYAEFSPSVLHVDNRVDVYAIEDGWVQIEYTDYGSYEDPQPKRRGWVPIDVVYGNE